jgi:hypothetical protein
VCHTIQERVRRRVRRERIAAGPREPLPASSHLRRRQARYSVSSDLADALVQRPEPLVDATRLLSDV